MGSTGERNTLLSLNKERSVAIGLELPSEGTSAYDRNNDTNHFPIMLKRGETYRLYFKAEAHGAPLISGVESSVRARLESVGVSVPVDSTEQLAIHDTDIKSQVAIHDADLKSQLAILPVVSGPVRSGCSQACCQSGGKKAIIRRLLHTRPLESPKTLSAMKPVLHRIVARLRRHNWP